MNSTAIGCLGYVTLEVGTLSNFDLFFVDIGHVFTTYKPMSITIDVNKNVNVENGLRRDVMGITLKHWDSPL